MHRINAYNLLYDFRDFIRCNRGKLIVIALLNITAVILGIRGGFAIGDASAYLFAHRTNVFVFIIGQKSIFGYFFVELLTGLVILALLALSSVHFLTAYLCFAVLFLRTYLFTLYLCLYISFLKLSVLPFVLVCLIPCYIIAMLLFTVVAILSVNRAIEIRLYGQGCNNTLSNYLQKMIVPCIMFVILTILTTVLSYFLTLGIIL